MRLPAAIVALLVAGCGGSASDAPQLLPDLVQVPPGALEVYDDDGVWRLAFLSSVENEGRGPMLIVGTRLDESTPAMSVEQVVRRSDGSTSTHAVDGEIRFVQSETHRHWHFLDFERYEILTLGGEAVSRDQKTGFCLGDRYNASRTEELPGEPDRAVWTRECGRGEAERLSIREGISPGYGDDYVPRLEGQSIDITGLPEGRYVLRHRVNVDRALLESDYENNSAETSFVLTWSESGTPTVVAVYQR